MRFSLLIICFVLSLCSFTSLNSDLEQGMGIDIIQGKQQLSITLTNNDCGASQISIYNSKGTELIISPVLNNTPHWSVSTDDWKTDIYTIQAFSINGYCLSSKTITIN